METKFSILDNYVLKTTVFSARDQLKAGSPVKVMGRGLSADPAYVDIVGPNDVIINMVHESKLQKIN